MVNGKDKKDKVVIYEKDIPKELKRVLKLPAVKNMLGISDFLFEVKVPSENMDKLNEISKSPEFEYYWGFFDRKREISDRWKKINIRRDVWIDLCEEEDSSDITFPVEFASNGKLKVVLTEKPSFEDFVGLCDFAYKMSLKVNNKGYWKKFALSFKNNIYHDSMFVVGLCDHDCYLTSERLDIATINGFRDRFVEFLKDKGSIVRFLGELTLEEKSKFRDVLIDLIMGEIVQKDFRSLIDSLRYDREKYLFAKEETRKFLSWLYSISPRVFREKLYDIKPDTLKTIAEFLPDEVSDYVSKKIMGSL